MQSPSVPNGHKGDSVPVALRDFPPGQLITEKQKHSLSDEDLDEIRDSLHHLENLFICNIFRKKEVDMSRYSSEKAVGIPDS